MYLTSEIKKDFFEKYGKSNKDTGSAEGQIALFSYRIAHLTEHLTFEGRKELEEKEIRKFWRKEVKKRN